jgi:two-component system, chemotaxis family, sensor kinase CheA
MSEPAGRWIVMDELTREFLIESQEGLDRMERCLTELEERPDDEGLVADIFRSVHTIKGTTGFLGFRRLEKLAHAGENLLGLLRDGQLAAAPPVITGLLQLLDGLRSILRTIEAEGLEGDESDAALIGRLEELQAPEAAAVKRPGRARTASVKARAGKRGGSKACDPKPSGFGKRSAKPSDNPSPAGAPAEQSAREENAAPVRSRPEPAGSAAESTLRVDIALLNRMMNLVGELVLTRNQALQAAMADPKMTLLSRRLDMVTADLRESVMKARMQPVSSIFSKMPRVVRDLTQILNRRVHLQMEGQETELDKSLLEAIKDPLTHAVRNALDHGIEPPDVRTRNGKDPEGTLTLRAVQEGSHVLIEVADDGAGIDVERVRRKAIERGLVSAESAAQQSEREMLQMIFLPGFSTASTITNVSGRGVGMDVVRTNVEKIGGQVEIESRVGKGTTLRLRIPLTLAIIPAIIVRSGDQSFALPQGAILEFVRVPAEQGSSMIEWIEDAPLFRLRERLLPLVFLNLLLHPRDVLERAADRSGFIAVLDADGRRFGLVVDGLADPEEIVVKPLSGALNEIGLYRGATVLGNGELALILDPGAIALKARIGLGIEDEAAPATRVAGAEAVSTLEYLLVEIAGRNAAVPLHDVLRIEQIQVSRVEYVRSRPVLNFEGQLLALEDIGGVLGCRRHDSGALVIVVICRQDARHIGIVVSHVLDVAAGKDLFEAGNSDRAPGVTLLKNRVVGIVDAGAAAQPGVESASPEWDQLAEAMR